MVVRLFREAYFLSQSADRPFIFAGRHDELDVEPLLAVAKLADLATYRPLYQTIFSAIMPTSLARYLVRAL